MRKLLILFSILVFIDSSFANNNFKIIEEWQISGSYSSKGSNSFYLDFLKNVGGEENLETDNLNWKVIECDSTGYLDLSKQINSESSNQIYYLTTIIKADEEKNAALTVGYTGGLQVWINGEKIYANRISRKPIADNDAIALHLTKGTNKILVKAEGGGDYFGFYFKLYEPEGNIFVNESKTVCPDFRINHKTNSWGQIEILNIGEKNISSLRINIPEDSLIISSTQTVNNIKPCEVKKIPFLVSTKKILKNSEPVLINLKINSEEEEEIINVKPITRNEDGYFVTTYLSRLDSSVQPYSMLLPKSFNADKKYSLVLLLHGAWVTGWAQNIISYDAKDWAIQVAVHGRGNNRYREVGDVELNEVIDEVKKQYKIYEDKMYLAGHSMGGYGTWFQAVRYPDRWTAISPQAGYANYYLYTDENEMPAYLKKLYNEWSPVLFAENLLHVAAYIVHGAKDDNVSVEHAREMSVILDSLNYNFIYDENPEGGHWWGPRGKNYGTEVVDKPAIWDFLLKFNEKKKYPSKVFYRTNTLRYNKAYWLTINEMDSIYSMAEVDAKINGNKINLQTKNITQITLSLNDSLISLDEPVEIFFNSRTIYNDVLISKNILIKKADDDFEILFDVESEDFSIEKNKILKKNHNVFGPLIDAFNSPFLFVTGKTKNELSGAINFCARSIAKSWKISAAGKINIITDGQISKEEIINNNLFLFGNEKTNKIIEEINQQLPIKFANNNFTSNGKTYSGNGAAFVEIFPSPFNSQKYIVVFGGTDEASFKNLSQLSLEKIPDYAILNSKSFSSDEVQFIDAGFFNKNWEIKK